MSFFSYEDPSLGVLAAALTMDLLIGEYPNAAHPVVWMGKTARALERLAPKRGAARQLAAGGVLALVVPGAFACAGLFVGHLHKWPLLAFLVATFVLKSTFSVRGLGHAAREVRDALSKKGIGEARFALRSLCSRDPSALDERLIVAATIESLAENASDSIVAPLLYYGCFGLPGALFYRAVNTLDAMVGYRGRYEYFGKASARLDDLLNLVPARLTAALLLVGGWLRGQDVRRGWRMLRRDGQKTASPNAGRPMAAMAGILGVELEKTGHYRLGDPAGALERSKIDEAWRVVLFAAGIAAALATLAVGARHVYPR